MIDLPAWIGSSLWVYLQVLARFSALVAVAPVFGARQVPAQVKIGLTLVLALALAPAVQRVFPAADRATPTDLYGFASPLVAQAMIGLMMGFVVSLILAAFQVAGSLLDLQVGFTMAQEFNPLLGDLAAPLSQFQYFYALLLFLLAGGHHILLLAMARSFALLPASAFHLASAPTLALITGVTFDALVEGLKIAAPTCAVLLAVDLSFAFLSRAMPQLNVFYIGMPAKVIAGLLILGLLLPATALFAGALVSGEPGALAGLLHALHRGATLAPGGGGGA